MSHPKTVRPFSSRGCCGLFTGRTATPLSVEGTVCICSQTTHWQLPLEAISTCCHEPQVLLHTQAVLFATALHGPGAHEVQRAGAHSPVSCQDGFRASRVTTGQGRPLANLLAPSVPPTLSPYTGQIPEEGRPSFAFSASKSRILCLGFYCLRKVNKMSAAMRNKARGNPNNNQRTVQLTPVVGQTD